MSAILLKKSKTDTLNNLDVPTYTEVGDRRLQDVKIGHEAAYRSSFGDHMSESVDPVTQIHAQYGIRPDTIETFSANGGAISGGTDNLFVCTTGTTVGGYGVLRTKRPTLYREGQGLMSRFTAIFDANNAVANSLQFAGLFNVQDTIAFGYRGTQFGILFDNYGAQEKRKLTITVAGNGTLTLTLNTVAYSIPITTGTAEHNAYEIAAWMDANQTIWDSEQVGSTVIFRNTNAAAAAGTYSVSGAGLSGTFSTIQTGVAKTESTILEADWNGETVDFDKSKGNVYMIKASYLGFGPISFYVLCPTDNVFKRVHTIKYSNANIKPSLSNRALKVGWVAASLGSTTNITVSGASAATFIEGRSSLISESHSQTNSNASVSTSFEAVLTIKASLVFAGKSMLGRVVPQRLEISTDSTKEVVFKLSKNATLGETNFQYHDESESVVEYDTGSHADSGNAHAIYTGQVGATGNASVDLKSINIDFFAGEYITLYAKVVSGAASSVTASFIWKEDI